MKILQEGQKARSGLFFLEVKTPAHVLMWAGKINFLVRLGSAPQIESFAVSAKEDESWGDCYTTTSKDSSLDEWATQALSLGTGSLDGTFTYHKNSYRVVFNEHGSLFIYSEKPLADGFITLVDSLLS